MSQVRLWVTHLARIGLVLPTQRGVQEGTLLGKQAHLIRSSLQEGALLHSYQKLARNCQCPLLIDLRTELCLINGIVQSMVFLGTLCSCGHRVPALCSPDYSGLSTQFIWFAAHGKGYVSI